MITLLLRVFVWFVGHSAGGILTPIMDHVRKAFCPMPAAVFDGADANVYVWACTKERRSVMRIIRLRGKMDVVVRL